MIPRAIIIMPTCSRGQQQLTTAAQQLPILDQYGHRYDVTLSYPRVTTLRGEEGSDDIASSSGQTDDIATSSPFSPLLQIWTYHRCDQPLNGPSHLIIIVLRSVLYHENVELARHFQRPLNVLANKFHNFWACYCKEQIWRKVVGGASMF